MFQYEVDERHGFNAAVGSGTSPSRSSEILRVLPRLFDWVDYKEADLLRRFITERGRMKARGAKGACAQHQRDVATAIKTARELALLPYSVRTVAAESRGARGGGYRPHGRGPTPRDAAGDETPTISADGGLPAGESRSVDRVGFALFRTVPLKVTATLFRSRC